MSMLLWVIIITAVAGIAGTGLGGLIGALFRKDSSKTASLLLSFAAGVMISVVCFDMISGALSPDENGKRVSVWIVLLGLSVGYYLVYLLNDAIDRGTNHELEHHTDDHPKTADGLDELIHSDHYNEHKKRNTSLFAAGIVMASAIALHNMPEGVVIGASYASNPDGSVWSGSGLLIAVIIGLHNIPEGMAVSVPLIAGGMPKPKAVLITALSGAPTVLGAILGYCVGLLGPVALSLSLAFAGGAMLYVVLGELLPQSILMWRSKLPALATFIGILVGILIIYV